MVLNKLQSDSPLSNIRALAACIAASRLSEEEIKAIKELKASKRYDSLFGPVSEWAIAVLDIKGVEKYTGNDSRINGIIKNTPDQPWVTETAIQLGVI